MHWTHRMLVAALVAWVVATVSLFASPAEARSWVAIDGDTIKLIEPIAGSKRVKTLRVVRVWGIDAPETNPWRAKCPREVDLGEAAKSEVARLLAEAVRVRIDRRDVREKYGRDLAGVLIVQKDGARVSLADHLVGMKLARPWLGHGPRPDWCNLGG